MYFQCFCSDCRRSVDENNISSLVYSGGTLRHGDSVLCINPKTGADGVMDISGAKRTNWLLLNAMFWPTLIFILSFVGLFFLGIRIAHENNSITKRKGPVQTRITLR